MIETAMLAVVMAAGPSINMDAPHMGAYAEQVKAASTWPAKWKDWAACTIKRESGGSLTNKQSREDAQSPGGRGRWQFIRPWRSGGAHMVAKQLIEHGVPKKVAQQVRVYLQATPIYEWDGNFQDALAIEVVQQGGALKHWWGKCDRLVP